MITIAIATRNEHKTGEIRALLSGQFHILTLRDFPDAPAVVEDKDTFAGNATKKSVELAQWLAANGSDKIKSPAYVLADDSGLEVDALHGAPGVFSARFAAPDHQSGNSSDDANNAKLLRLLRDVPPEKRTARFRCVLALTPIEKDKLITELFDGACEGCIETKASGGGGFGYDPLFVPSGERLTFAELGEAAKNRISHRAKALEKLRKKIAVF